MIRPAYRKFYASAWRKFRARLLEVRGAICRDCGREVTKYLNLSHDTHDPATSGVTFRCAKDHARHDARHRLAVQRRNRAARFGQLWLSPELEHAATPAWLIPREAIAAIYAQGRLF